MTAPSFRPLSFEEIKTEQLIAAFPGEKLEGLRYKDADPYISPSQVKMANRCLEQYRRRYVKGEKTRPAKALVWGSADHATFENYFAGTIATGQRLTIAEIKELFATKLDEGVEKDGGLLEVVWDDKQPNMSLGDARKAFGKTKDDGVLLAAAYGEQAAPAIDPLFVERAFELRIPGSPVPIRGQIDLGGQVPKVAGDTERVNRIIDRKTSGRRGMQGEWHVQGRIYQLVEPLPIEWQLSVKTKTPGIVAFDPAYTFDPPAEKKITWQIQRTLGLIASCYMTYGPDEPWPDGMAHSWACDFCGFRPDCPWWTS